ncbi:MAG: hypothetical protein AAGI51_05540 [Pseudomonadota bacterium]
MRRSRLGPAFAALAALGVMSAPEAASSDEVGAAERPLSLELNRLSTESGNCRADLVIANATEKDIDALQLDLVLFDPDGVIARRLAVQVAPLRSGRTSVRSFAIRGLACEGVGRVLLNDVAECRVGGDDVADCIELIETSSKASIDFID